jgi:hypothetical protein
MASRKEEKERLREIREQAEKREASEQRRKLILGYAVAGVLAAAVVVGIVLVVIGSSESGASGNAHIVAGPPGSTTTMNLDPDEREGTKTKAGPMAEADKLTQAARAAKCVLRNPPEEGNTHLLPSQNTPKYKSDPPTSGNHDPVPLSNGVYSSPLPSFRNALHTLEHGRVGILYQPDLPDPDQLVLKGVVDEDFRDMVMSPWERMEWEVAAVAWGHYLGCRSYNDDVPDAIRAFRDTYRGQGPEPTSVQPS